MRVTYRSIAPARDGEATLVGAARTEEGEWRLRIRQLEVPDHLLAARAPAIARWLVDVSSDVRPDGLDIEHERLDDWGGWAAVARVDGQYIVAGHECDGYPSDEPLPPPPPDAFWRSADRASRLAEWVRLAVERAPEDLPIITSHVVALGRCDRAAELGKAAVIDAALQL